MQRGKPRYNGNGKSVRVGPRTYTVKGKSIAAGRRSHKGDNQKHWPGDRYRIAGPNRINVA